MIHRIVLFLKFASSSEDFQSYLYGIERTIELPLTVRLLQSLRIEPLLESQISTIVDSSQKARSAPA